MKLPLNGDRLQAKIALTRGELSGTFAERRRRIELKAEQKRQQAKTAIARAKVKAQKDKEMADLEREMYEARLAAQQAQARAKSARHAAGVYTPGEKFGRAVRATAKTTSESARSFYRGLTAETKKRKRSTRRRSTARRRS
jgi:hypothetical protein